MTTATRAQQTLDEIKKSFAKLVREATGIDVELTLISETRFSVYMLDKQHAQPVCDFLQRVPGFVFEELVTYDDEPCLANECCAFFRNESEMKA